MPGTALCPVGTSMCHAAPNAVASPVPVPTDGGGATCADALRLEARFTVSSVCGSACGAVTVAAHTQPCAGMSLHGGACLTVVVTVTRGGARALQGTATGGASLAIEVPSDLAAVLGGSSLTLVRAGDLQQGAALSATNTTGGILVGDLPPPVATGCASQQLQVSRACTCPIAPSASVGVSVSFGLLSRLVRSLHFAVWWCGSRMRW
jgi:hypothetical protein